MLFGSWDEVKHLREGPKPLSEMVRSESQQEAEQERRQSNQKNLLLFQSFNVCVLVVDELQSRRNDLGFVAAFSDVHLIRSWE